MLWGAVPFALACVGYLLIFGAAWASSKLLPLFHVFTAFALVLILFIVLPLAIPRRTRATASVALFLASYVFGATLWMEGLLFTLLTWGPFAVFLGLFMFGVGVVPIAMLATLLKGMWHPLIDLVLLTTMTFGSRIIALRTAASLEGYGSEGG